MKAVFVGAGSLAVATARRLLQYGHEVVIIEADKARIDTLAESLDCGFLHGDGSTPAILAEAAPGGADFLFCLTGDDRTNILAGLVGRSQGYGRVVPKIEDPGFEHLCVELGLVDFILPARTIGRYLADMFEGRDPFEMVGLIKGEARVLSFIAGEADEGPVEELGLPEDSRVILVYRGEGFFLPDPDSRLRRGDEVVIITHSRHLEALQTRWRA